MIIAYHYHLAIEFAEMVERRTKQKDALLAVFQEAGRPLSVPEVHALAKLKLSRIGVATVYRRISNLVAADILSVVELPGTSLRFELSQTTHSSHFCCHDCRRVYGLVEQGQNVAALIPPGFLAERHELVVYGRCPQCAE